MNAAKVKTRGFEKYGCVFSLPSAGIGLALVAGYSVIFQDSGQPRRRIGICAAAIYIVLLSEGVPYPSDRFFQLLSIWVPKFARFAHDEE